MVDLMMWLVIAALLLAAAIQSIGYYQQASLTYQAKSDLSGEHSWAAARTALDTKAPTSVEMSAALTAGDLKLTSNGGIYNIGVIATTGDKYCLGVKAPNVKGNNVFYSTSDAPNNVMTDVALPAFCGTATEVTTTGGTTASPTSTATASPTATSTATASPTPTPAPTFTTVNWTAKTETTTTNIYSASASADLSHVLALGSGTIDNYLSTDGGTSWAKGITDPAVSSFEGGAVSADGMKMVTGGYNNNYAYIWTSNDGGTTWTQHSGTGTAGRGYWGAFAISNDGTKMVASDTSGGYIWTTADSGATWTKSSTGGTNNAFVAMTADGSTLYAPSGNGLKVSTNLGASWTVKPAFAGSTYPVSMKVSPDGTNLLVGTQGTGANVYSSTDSGATWTTRAFTGLTSTSVTWQGVGMSSDGTRMAAADYNNKAVWFSLDSGANWTKAASLPASSWRSVMVSADGTKYLAVSLQGLVYSGAIG